MENDVCAERTGPPLRDQVDGRHRTLAVACLTLLDLVAGVPSQGRELPATKSRPVRKQDPVDELRRRRREERLAKMRSRG